MIGLIVFYGLGLVTTAMIGALMLFSPLSWRDEDQEKEKRRGAKTIILSPMWPVLALAGIKFVWVKARETLRGSE